VLHFPSIITVFMSAYRSLARHAFTLAALLTAAAPAHAAEQVVALSPAEKEALLNAAAERNSGRIDEPTINGVGRRIHGEISMMIGTGGARGIGGSMVAPIGETGMVAFAFESVRYGNWR
jgi:hypothetical protein